MDADIAGRLVFDEGQCLLLEMNTDERGLPVVWPAGASWQADPPGVDLEGRLVEPGDIVSGSGGVLKGARATEFAGSTVVNAAEACVGQTGEIIFFNKGSKVEVQER